MNMPYTCAVLRALPYVEVLGTCEHLERPSHLINGQFTAARVVLARAREERLREEEARDPILGGDTLVDPLVDELQALEQVAHPAAERHERGVRGVGPEDGHTAADHRFTHRLELHRHDHLSADRALDVHEARLDSLTEHVEASELLEENCVHRLVV